MNANKEGVVDSPFGLICRSIQDFLDEQRCCATQISVE